MANQKTPTSLLLTPEGAFHSFGYTARDYYHDLDPEEARDWLYFEKFKMKIHSTSVSPCFPCCSRSIRHGEGVELTDGARVGCQPPFWLFLVGPHHEN